MNLLFFFNALTGHITRSCYHTYSACIMSDSVSRSYSSVFHVADFFKGHIVSSKSKLYSLYATQEKWFWWMNRAASAWKSLLHCGHVERQLVLLLHPAGTGCGSMLSCRIPRGPGRHTLPCWYHWWSIVMFWVGPHHLLPSPPDIGWV